MAVGDWTLERVENRVRLPEEVEVPLYRSVLAAGSERAEEATRFALAVLGVPPPSAPGRAEQSINTRVRHSDRPNFRTLCLEADALRPLWTRRPDLAAQIIEQCAIEPPPHPLELGTAIGHEDLGITDAPHWMTPLPERGCFLAFLRDAPDEAVGLVVRLANHATERWVERELREGVSTPPLDIESDNGRTTQWSGDQTVLGWHRGNGHAPSVLTCALMALEQWLYERHDAGDDLTSILIRLRDETRSLAIIGVLCSLGCREPALFTGALRPLLAVAELYSWEHQTKLQTPPSLMLPGFHEPAEMLERARAWHGLSHRRYELEWVVLTIMFGDADVEAFLTRARERWLQRADDTGDRQRDMLRHLAARFDRGNYRAAHLDGQDVWKYQLPADLRADADAAAAEVQRALFWSSRPYQLREYIDGEPVGSEEAAEELWDDTTRRLAEPVIEEFEREGVRRRVDVECALAATLIVKHRSWLTKNPERAQWCRDTIREALAKPAARPWFDDDTNPSEDRWDCFCADAVAALWADAPDDLELRGWVLQLATGPHYAVVARMFARCADRRDRLGPWFGRLEHVAVRWALARAVILAHRHRPGPKPAELPAATQTAIEAFASGTLDPELPQWAADALETPPVDAEAEPPRQRRRGRRRAQPAAGMDMNYLAAAFRWLPALGEARDEHERARWLTFWRQILDVLQRRLDADDLVDDHSGPMMRWEHWALHRLGGELLELRSDDNPRDLWEPIMHCGAHAEYWVEGFLRGVFSAGLDTPGREQALLPVWRALIEYAQHSPTWQPPNTGLLRPSLALLGLDTITRHHWRTEHAALVENVREPYGEWCRTNLRDSWFAGPFMRFLTEPAARAILAPSLLWLRDAESSRPARHNDSRHDNALAELLVHISREHPALLRGDEATATAARELLTTLAARHHPVGLELVRILAAGDDA